jgi:formylmethanofuran dehydrogenase subunit E-like metal-binding protein
VCTDDYNSTAYEKSVSATNSSGNVTLNNTTSLANNSPIIFTGTTFGGITANTVYYIKAVGTGGNITISQSRTNGVADTVFTLTSASGTCVATAYVGSDIWKRIALTSW